VPLDPAVDAFAAPAPGSPGDGSRVGVLLVHGFTGSPASMRPWAEYLHEQGYAVSVPLLPGHGTVWQDMVRVTYDDWYAEAEGAFDKLLADCDLVFLAGLSMGACVVLDLAARRGRDVAGIVVVNPSVSTERWDVKLLPVLKHVVRAFPGIRDDIKKPGVTELAYPKTPLRPAHSLMQGMKAVRERLPEVTQPMLVFRSREDHVVPASSVKRVLTSVSSRDLEERVLEDSYHVATLDNDAPVIYSVSAEFVRRVSIEAPPATGAEGP
jgi:carboxylesterase